MKAKHLAVVLLAFVGGGVVQAQAPNWLVEFMVVRAPQTRIVRDRMEYDKYYLCWQDGSSRYGTSFSRRNLSNKLRGIRPGEGTGLPSIFSISESSWSALGEQACWGG